MLISIIVPTYNQCAYLRPCLDAIWFQDYPEIEIVLVNDGATDDTAEVIEAFVRDVESASVSFASRYDQTVNEIRRVFHPRYPKQGRTLRILSHGVNRGLAAALNTGFMACKGEICTYVPSDNICISTMISDLAAPLSKGFDFTYGDMFIVDDAMNVMRKFELPDYSFSRCFGDWYLCGVAKLYRRELHDRFAYYNEKLLAHDHELFQRFAMGGARFFHVNKPLMYVRAHENDREVDIHSPTNWNRLLEESKQIVVEARDFISKGKGVEGQ